MAKIELLSPVQDFTSLRAAIDAGADAVYFGIQGFNMRAGAKNFKISELPKVVSICHKNKIKAYLTVNTIIYENELAKLKKVLKKAEQAKIDAIICWDWSVISECEKLNLPIHLSTQASVSNFTSLFSLTKKIKNLKSVILARECSLEDIKKIIKKIKKHRLDIKIETFIHGAMCISVSGRCFLSQHLFNKSANRGECLQPCRRKYLIKDIEEKHELEIGEDYIISPKDLCTMPFIEKLINAGIGIFKIEGRNRSPEYVKAATESYRKAIGIYQENKLTKAEKNKLVKKLETVYNRGFSSGFFLGKPINEWSQAYGSKAAKKKAYIGVVANYYKKPSVAEIKVESQGFKLNDILLFQGPTTGVQEQKVSSMQLHHKNIKKAEKGKNIAVKANFVVRKNDKVFVIIK